MSSGKCRLARVLSFLPDFLARKRQHHLTLQQCETGLYLYGDLRFVLRRLLYIKFWIRFPKLCALLRKLTELSYTCTKVMLEKRNIFSNFANFCGFLRSCAAAWDGGRPPHVVGAVGGTFGGVNAPKYPKMYVVVAAVALGGG